MIMAAGLGTRLRPFTQVLPKPLLPVLGVPCLNYSLFSLSQTGVRDVVINSHHLHDRMGPWLSDQYAAHPFQTHLSDESELLLGSAGGIRKALSILGKGEFFLLNADVLSTVNLAALESAHRAAHRRFGARMTLAVLKSSDPDQAYTEILFDPLNDRVTGIGAKQKGTYFYCGSAVAEESLFAHLEKDRPADFTQEVLLPAIERGEVAAFPTSALWLDIGSPVLWWKAHFELMKQMETGRLPASWRQQIEAINFRKASEVWVNRDCPGRIRIFSSLDSPAYLNVDPRADASAPLILGPHAVLYLTRQEKALTGLQKGIQYGNERVEFRAD